MADIAIVLLKNMADVVLWWDAKKQFMIPGILSLVLDILHVCALKLVVHQAIILHHVHAKKYAHAQSITVIEKVAAVIVNYTRNVAIIVSSYVNIAITFAKQRCF
jgi:hypothetical protein